MLVRRVIALGFALSLPVAAHAAEAPLTKQVTRYAKYFKNSEGALRGGGVTPHAEITTRGVGLFFGIGGARAGIGEATVFHNGWTYKAPVADFSVVGGLVAGGGGEKTDTYILGKRGMNADEVLPKTYVNKRVNLFFAGEGTDRGGKRTWSATLGPSVAFGIGVEKHKLVLLDNTRVEMTPMLKNIEEGKDLAARAAAYLKQGKQADASAALARMEYLHAQIDADRMEYKMSRRAVGGSRTP